MALLSLVQLKHRDRLHRVIGLQLQAGGCRGHFFHQRGIVAVNQAWRDFSACNGGQGNYIGYNYLSQCDAEVTRTTNGDLHLAEGIRAVLRGELAEFTFDYPCHSQTEQRWFSARVAHFRNKDPHVVVAHLNVTGLQKTVLEREFQQRQLQRLQRLYAALTEADHLIANSSDLDTLFSDICRFAVDLGGMSMAWIGTPDLESERIVPICSYGEGVTYLDGIYVSTRSDVAEGCGPTGTAYNPTLACARQALPLEVLSDFSGPPRCRRRRVIRRVK